jgi:hypothetical protein
VANFAAVAWRSSEVGSNSRCISDGRAALISGPPRRTDNEVEERHADDGRDEQQHVPDRAEAAEILVRQR